MAKCVECGETWSAEEHGEELLRIVCDHFEQEHAYF